MDKSWMRTPRTSKSYEDGVAAFLQYAVHHLKEGDETDDEFLMSCPCTFCLNLHALPVGEVDEHLFTKGIDQMYTKWTKHGEKDEASSSMPANVNNGHPTESEDFGMGIPTDAQDTIEMVEAAECFAEDPQKFKKILEDAEKPLYEGCPNFTRLSAIVQLFNLKSKYGASDTFFDELLPLLKNMLPEEGNVMVKSMYEAKKIMKSMGSGYTKIHACKNDCILYRGLYKDENKCPICGISRWKVDKEGNVYKNVPAKVLWYFPIIPRFQRLFQSKPTAKDVIWHHTSRKRDGVLRHPADSEAWRVIDDKFPEIAGDARNLWLGVSADGVDVNKGTKPHSVWPVLIVIYNLPPWLCMKRKFIMLSLLIDGAPGKNIDVYLEVLVEDLQFLFEKGIRTWDAYAQEMFTLRAVVLWTINDYPALGTLCGCPYSGYDGCVVCRRKTHCIRLPFSSKQSYGGHRRFLPYDHPFRRQKKAFNGEQEWGTAPEPMTGEEIYEEVKHIKNSSNGTGGKDTQVEYEQANPGRGGKMKRIRKTSKGVGRLNGEDNETTYWKRYNIWQRRLRYWRYNLVQHCIDFMHVEKNVGESLVGTLLHNSHTKDGLEARMDLVHFGLRPELVPQTDDKGTTLPAACYTLTKEEKDKFCETLYELRVPEGYCSNFATLVNRKERKLIGLKSHDYHMLMQQFLPVAIRSIMPQPVRYAITRFCFFFRSISAKEIKVEELDKLQADLCVTLCLLEKYFLPSFFDIMIHLTVHLTREVKLCGPVCFRWMYPFERCMKVIKGHVRNKNRPCGCIAEQNVTEETIETYSEYQRSMKTVGIPLDMHTTSHTSEDSETITEGKPISYGEPYTPSPEQLLQAHFYVMQNTPEIEPYIDQHKLHLRKENPAKRQAWLEKEHANAFSDFLRKKVEEELAVSKESVSENLRWISHGPHYEVTKYTVYRINGYLFRTKSREGRIHQNSGVSVEADAMHISRNGVVTYGEASYYGVLKEIWELDYSIRKIPLFKCDWVDNKHGVKKDSLGYKMVDLSMLAHTNDPFIFASQARQVFYVKDQLHKKMSIVFGTPPRNYRDAYDDGNGEEFSTVIFHQNDNILPGIDPKDLGKESRNDYFRDDCRGLFIRKPNRQTPTL